MVVLLSFAAPAQDRADYGWSKRPEGGAGVSATAKEPADAANAYDSVVHAPPHAEAFYARPFPCQASTPDPCLTPLGEATARWQAAPSKCSLLRCLRVSPKIASTALRSIPFF